MKGLLRKPLAVTLAVVESAGFEDGCLAVSVRPGKTQMRRCPVRGRKAAAHDGIPRAGRWGSLDSGSARVHLEHAASRAGCPERGVHAEPVPWAHPASRFAVAFEEQAAWLCVHASRGAGRGADAHRLEERGCLQARVRPPGRRGGRSPRRPRARRRGRDGLQEGAEVRAVGLGIGNARVEAINNKIELTVRMGYGFRNIDNLMALVMLRCSNLPIALPGRS